MFTLASTTSLDAPPSASRANCGRFPPSSRLPQRSAEWAKRAPNVSAKGLRSGWFGDPSGTCIGSSPAFGAPRARSTSSGSCLPHKDRHPGAGNQRSGAGLRPPRVARPGCQQRLGRSRPGQAENPKLPISMRLRKRPAPASVVVHGMRRCCAIGGHPTGERTDQTWPRPGQIKLRIAVGGLLIAASARQSGIVPARSRPKVPPTVSDAMAVCLKRIALLCLAVVASFGLTACGGAQGPKPPRSSAEDLADDPAPGRRFPCAQRPAAELASW